MGLESKDKDEPIRIVIWILVSTRFLSNFDAGPIQAKGGHPLALGGRVEFTKLVEAGAGGCAATTGVIGYSGHQYRRAADRRSLSASAS